MWTGYLVSFGLAFVLSLILTTAMIRLAPRLGLVDEPSARKIHTKPVPLGGGIAIVLALLGVAAVGAGVVAVLNARPGLLPVPESIRIHIPGMVSSLKRLGAIVLGAIILALTGLVDDKRGLSPWTKLSVQILVALLLVASGVSITLFLPWKAAGWTLTVGWIIFITNSFNLLDNMDGLAAGVAFIIAVVFFAVALITGQIFIALFLAVFAGAVLGFLVFNFPPARIFMGDTGSYVLGYFLGVAAVVFTFVPQGSTKASVL
ncbi:MAG: undecaprenyl/decaprenyl-phosphate alpha-N-acetylglucosaminyl 1-phosphate transferase, partial [Planctomycetes bacterium]|nr:undecaprenyl/decaprenyl-phosphate alpha-N-acetylglucosaminyl 1-phosphate transferase [Planctomycetota bacterium]